MTFLFAHPDFENELLEECRLLNLKPEKMAKLLYAVPAGAVASAALAKHKNSFIWARDVWPEVEIMDVESVSKAVAVLRNRSKKPWRQVTTSSHRRGELIETEFSSKTKMAALRKPKKFWPETTDRRRENPAFTILPDGTIALCVSPREENPGGQWLFDEDRTGPPSRAYLKLWEWGWRTDILPKPGETALDLGACPGGWTWVLIKGGLEVHAFDRSPLAESLKKDLSKSEFGRIHFAKADAFQITPDQAPRTDWVFCDVIAEPKRTVELIEAWMPTKAGLVFTIKFKGATDFQAIERLKQLPAAHLRHLDVNKHEITFWRLPVVSK